MAKSKDKKPSSYPNWTGITITGTEPAKPKTEKATPANVPQYPPASRGG